jgi:hypothetical protein
LLLGDEISGAAIPLGRVAGIALLALGGACWFASGETKSRAALGLVAAMLVYNVGVMAVLLSVGLTSQPVGIALWSAVILHTVMGVWCVTLEHFASRHFLNSALFPCASRPSSSANFFTDFSAFLSDARLYSTTLVRRWN